MEFMKARINILASDTTAGAGQAARNIVEVSYLSGQDEGKTVSGPTACVSLLEMIFTLADQGWQLMFTADGWHFFQRCQPGDVAAAVEGFSARPEFTAPIPLGLDQWEDARGQGQGQ